MPTPTLNQKKAIAIELGERLEVGRRIKREPQTTAHKVTSAYLPPGVVRPADRGSFDRGAPPERVKFEEYELQLESTGTTIGIGPEGLDRTYGIFGQTGSGKTPLIMHMLRQILQPEMVGRKLHFGGLLLDPKGEYYKSLRTYISEGGRQPDKILIPIGDHQDERDSVNIIDVPMSPRDLGHALGMAAQSVGITAHDPAWMNQLKGLFAATLHVLSVAYATPPTLADMARALLNDVDSPKDDEGLSIQTRDAAAFVQRQEGNLIARKIPTILLVMQFDLPGAEAGLTAEEKQDIETSKSTIYSFFSEATREFVILRDFIREAYGEFMYAPCKQFCASAHGQRKSIYKEVIEDGKIILVNVSTEHIAISKILSTVIKCLFQQTILMRERPNCHFENNDRQVFLIADEYSEVATDLGGDPIGDAKFFSLARAFRCLAIVATQSVNMMLQTLRQEDWKAIYTNLTAKIFMKLGDPESAAAAKQLASESEFLVVTYSRSQDRGRTTWQVNWDQREKVDFPVKLLTDGFASGEAMVIGNLVGSADRKTVERHPSIQIFRIPEAV